MGIVNLNDDSFCNDGTLDSDAALAQAEQMLRDGADIIDIGAESARTNRGPITVEEEVRRLMPFIERWAELVCCARFSACSPPERAEARTTNQEPILSINTWRSEVVEQVLPLGGDILNDLSALPDARNAELCAKHGVAMLIMHSVGQPKVPHTHVDYDDVMGALDAFFEEKIALACSIGLSMEQIILDPGIDFAKQREDNLCIYRELERLQRFDRPILLPVSRKTVIGEVLGLGDPLERDAGTLACIAAGMRRGAHIFRVHNVKAAAQAVKVLWGLQGGTGSR
ncbi:MAG: dihydropteroate synthase [Verrucomicrobia bacterium]|nr:dihydropteroate synthase [Verrucomicrobiota bacterium]